MCACMHVCVCAHAHVRARVCVFCVCVCVRARMRGVFLFPRSTGGPYPGAGADHPGIDLEVRGAAVLYRCTRAHLLHTHCAPHPRPWLTPSAPLPPCRCCQWWRSRCTRFWRDPNPNLTLNLDPLQVLSVVAQQVTRCKQDLTRSNPNPNP